MTAPLIFQWNGEAMRPLGRFARLAAEAFTAGEQYRMEVAEARSWATHAHQFAWLYDAWLSLPERYAIEPWAQSSEHLRKYALIKTGWSNTQTWACGTKAEAGRWAANMRPEDEYSIVVAQGSTVTRYTAKSQAKRLMGAKDFQASKTAIMDFIAELLGVDPADLAGRSTPTNHQPPTEGS